MLSALAFSTDTLLRAVLNKEWGILPKGRVLTHIAMAELPSYHKLLFLSDAAVIPYPTHEQRVQQVAYMAQMLHAFGIEEPRIALIHCASTIRPCQHHKVMTLYLLIYMTQHVSFAIAQTHIIYVQQNLLTHFITLNAMAELVNKLTS